VTTTKIRKAKLSELLKDWGQRRTIFLPSQEKGITSFEEWDGGDVDFVDWYRNTINPPKSLFFPQMEEMFNFYEAGDSYKIEQALPEGRERLIFCIRPCDAHAIAILDPLFKDSYTDPYYVPRRENTLLVGLGCTRPYDACFCTSLGIDPARSDSVDLMFTDIGDYFLIEEITDRGKALLSETGVTESAEQGDEVIARERAEDCRQRVSKGLPMEGLDKRLRANFGNKDYWERVAYKCISCGICTYFCPTCHCFDINDDAVDQQGARLRNWDTCQFATFTKMPMENPRVDRWKRVRQRVHHKFEYYPMNFGVTACVGCGRCVRLCPVNWDITQTLIELPEV